MMVRKIPPDKFYRIRSPTNFYSAISSDVELLHASQAYVSMTTVILCCLDALAAGSGKATRGKFEKFVERYFPDLCHALSAICNDKKGSSVLYDNYRNGFAHLRGPKDKFAIAENHEPGGEWAGQIKVDGVGQFVAINVDRLAKEFQEFLKRRGQKAPTENSL